MRVLLLASASSIHTVRWANALSEAGLEIVLATQHDPLEQMAPSVRIHRLPYSGEIGYFRNVRALKQILVREKPDLVNAHYVSGYGTTARLSGFKPLLISVWGSDVYDFPEKSSLHRWWTRANLMAATRVASTSHAMAKQTRCIAPALGDIAITPFGVETDHFAPCAQKRGDSDGPIVVGTVKTLREKYGIDTLVNAFVLLRHKLSAKTPKLAERLRLRIVGDGPQREELGQLAARHGIASVTHFGARIPHDAVPEALRELDIYVALSRQESFGVAVIEAGACGLPVVVSDVGGLPEVVANGETGIIVPKENPEAAATALERLVLDSELRQAMGAAGRKRVETLYDWNNNVSQMIALYEDVVTTSRN